MANSKYSKSGFPYGPDGFSQGQPLDSRTLLEQSGRLLVPTAEEQLIQKSHFVLVRRRYRIASSMIQRFNSTAIKLNVFPTDGY